MKKKTKIILLLCLAVLIAALVGGFAYVSDYYHADAQAVTAMSSPGGGVSIETDGSVTWFMPDEPAAGLIFYPGGKVEYSAYAPLMLACAQRGIVCALVKMPANLAVLDVNAAEGLSRQHPEIEDWYIAGHSLGGAMAAGYAASHADELEGLVLLAAYSTKDLSRSGLRVLSVYGSADGVMDRDSYAKYRAGLPEDTTELIIEGGCHAQFGSYGAQDGDGEPAISGAEQIRLTADAIAAFVGGE